MPMGAAYMRSNRTARASCCGFLIFLTGSQLPFKTFPDDKANIIGLNVDSFRSCTRFRNKDRPLLFRDSHFFNFRILGGKIIGCGNRDTKIRFDTSIKFPLLFQLFFTENGTGYMSTTPSFRWGLLTRN